MGQENGRACRLILVWRSSTEANVTQQTLETYRRRLQEMADRLIRKVTDLRAEAFRPAGSEAGGMSVVDADRQGDPGAEAAGGRAALTLLGTEGHILAEANAALDRIDRGTFGRCEACDQAITRVRLDALPYARLCIRCARADGNGRPCV